jgi:hypothetical protein
LQVIQTVLRDSATASVALEPLGAIAPNLVLAFGPAHWLSALVDPLSNQFPNACRLGCTTAGEISTQGVSNDTCVVTLCTLMPRL